MLKIQITFWIKTCSKWTIPQLDKLLNSKTILPQLERAS